MSKLGPGLINPLNDDSGDFDCCHECMRAAIIPGCNTSPVLEFTEHILYLVSLTIEKGIIVDLF